MKLKECKKCLIVLIAAATLVPGVLMFFAYKVAVPLDSLQADAQTVLIEQGMGLGDIAQLLEDEGLISNDFYFTIYGIINGNKQKMQAGEYELAPNMSVKKIAAIIAGGNVKGFVRVTIPEGFRMEQIAKRLAQNEVVETEAEFLSASRISTAAAYDIYRYNFLLAMNANSLEGLLFPDTYEFQKDSSAGKVLDKFLGNFERKVADLPANYNDLIMASLLEREVQTEEDMKLVAGVLYNRLQLGMPLQVDATLAYITGKKTGELTNSDKEIDSPFNTYMHRGLPIAPIANPGLKAISAALNPTPTNYLYYLNAPDGTTYFAETLDEHNKNKAKYLTGN